jgi:cyclopropane-fatty-acyl-phospholipid synthase
VFWDKPLDNALSRLKDNVQAPVRVVLWDGREVSFSESPRCTLRLKRASLALSRPNLLTLAEAYIDGDADLEGDVREAIRGAVQIARAMPQSLFRSQGPTNARHTKRGDREAIQHHYDVSNEFYQLWLDPRMVYSCAYFRNEGDSLETAQLQKLDHICAKLRLKPGERFLDIGCGKLREGECALDGGCAELRRRGRREYALECADGRAGGGGDYDLSVHLFLLTRGHGGRD